MAFLDVCKFLAASAGSSDFIADTAVLGYQTPSSAGVTNGATYSYRAESSDLTEWEVGTGTYTTGTSTLIRNVLFNSLGTTAKISFTNRPNVAIVALAEDLDTITANIATNTTDIATNTTAISTLNAARPMFSVHKNSTDQTGVVDVTYTQITWSTELQDVGSHFASNLWTPPAGVITLVGKILLTGTWAAGNAGALALYKNGSILQQVTTQASAANAATINGAWIDKAGGSDTYGLYCYIDVDSSTATISGSASNTWFAGAWIGA